MVLLRLIWAVVHALFANRTDLVAENLALRQQLIRCRSPTPPTAAAGAGRTPRFLEEAESIR